MCVMVKVSLCCGGHVSHSVCLALVNGCVNDFLNAAYRDGQAAALLSSTVSAVAFALFLRE